MISLHSDSLCSENLLEKFTEKSIILTKKIQLCFCDLTKKSSVVKNQTDKNSQNNPPGLFFKDTMVVQDRRSPTQDMIRLIRIKILPSRVEVLPSKVKIPTSQRRSLLQGNPGSQGQSYSHSYWVGQLQHGVSRSQIWTILL